MLNLNHRKVPVFSGINDSPVEPTTAKAGNGADIVARINGLVDDVQAAFNGLPDVSSSLPLILTQPTTWYVDPINGNDDYDGLTPDTAFRSLYKTIQIAASYINKDNHDRTIQLLDGNHYACVLSNFKTLDSSGTIRITGNSSDPSRVRVFGVIANDLLPFSKYILEYFTVEESFSGPCLITNNAHLQLGYLRFGQTSDNHIVLNNRSSVEIVDNYFVAGSATKSHIYLDNFSYLNFNPNRFAERIVDCSAAPTFNTFTNVNRHSYLHVGNTKFHGSATGRRFNVDLASTIETATGDLLMLPGDTDGIISRNSQYV